MAKVKTEYGRKLFDFLLKQMLSIEPVLRAGSMFGCPAGFVEGRLAFCVFGSTVGIKVPEGRARMLIREGKAASFRPYGRSPMREWIQFTPVREELAGLIPVLVEAVEYAREHGKET